MHCDTILALYKSIDTQSLENNHLHIDLNKMSKGDYLVQNFALFINLNSEEDPLERCLKLVDLYYNEIEENNQIIAPALNGADILENKIQGKMSSLLTIEEGGVAKGSLAHLRNFYRLGVRMLTLTWNYENEIGYPATIPNQKKIQQKFSEDNKQKGLKEFGIEFIQEMEQLGMIIDVSHLSDDGVRDVLKNTQKPFVASHSNARVICNHRRNLTDELIKKMANRGCVIGINYYPPFLEEDSTDNTGEGTIASIINHIKHIINIGGTDCIGLGSDFDGISGHEQLKDASYLPKLAQSLDDEGIPHKIIEKIFYKNVISLYLDVLK